jgi:hypothetical protein
MFFPPRLSTSIKIELALLSLFFLSGVVYYGWNWIHKRWMLLCSRKRMAVAMIGLLGFASAASVGILFRIPEASIHDEFCYLLAADTFCSGRLANPPHPMWRYFETFHVLQSPTYSAKYFPGQGLMLALGQKLSGYPILGVWINMGLLCAALCWMLQGWVPPRWALLGSLIGLTRLEFTPDLYSQVGFGYWAQSYWGGGVPALSGALVYGALPRLVGKAPKVSHAILMGVGFSIMALSRPYEGICASLPALAYLLYHSWNRKPVWKTWLCRIALPVGGVLGLCLVWLGYYNFRVTGSPLVLPYWLYSLTYCGVPELCFIPLRPTPLSPHWNIWWFNSVYSFDLYKPFASPQLWPLLADFFDKILKSWSFMAGALWTAPLCLLPWMMGSKQMQFLVGAFGFAMAGIMLTVGFFPHYAATVLGLFLILLVQAVRHCHCWRYGKWDVGKIFTTALVLTFLVATSYTLYLAHRWSISHIWVGDRRQIATGLLQIPGKHLVIVRYERTHNVHEEWVYNTASIDASRIVWARNLETDNAELCQYYSDRTIWRLEVDERGMPLSLIRRAGQ